MLKPNIVLSIAAALLFAAPAFAQDPPGAPGRDRDTTRHRSETQTGVESQGRIGHGGELEGAIFGSTPISSPDLVSRLHQINQHEIEMARLAENRGTSKAVKDYARTLGSDHQKSDRKLNSLAAKKGWTLSSAVATAGSESDDTRHHEMLTNLTGRDFDRAFLLMMQKGHDHAVLLMTSQLSTSLDGDLQKALKAELPTLEKHRKQAIDLLQREGTKLAPTG